MRRWLRGLLVATLLALASAAQATIFTGTDGVRSASGKFVVGGDVLSLIITNTSPSDTLVPIDVLTGIYWNGGGPNVLVPLSAVITAGSTVQNAAFPPGGIIGGEVAYASGIAGPGGTTHGVSTAGLGLFGGPSFPGVDLWPPAAVDGLQAGLVSAGDDPSTGNAPILTEALIKNSITVTFTGATGFDPNAIDRIWFQYGTALTEPGFGGCSRQPCGNDSTPIPEPATQALLGIGLLGLALARTTRRRKPSHA